MKCQDLRIKIKQTQGGEGAVSGEGISKGLAEEATFEQRPAGKRGEPAVRIPGKGASHSRGNSQGEGRPAGARVARLEAEARPTQLGRGSQRQVSPPSGALSRFILTALEDWIIIISSL